MCVPPPAAGPSSPHEPQQGFVLELSGYTPDFTATTGNQFHFCKELLWFVKRLRSEQISE